MNAGPPGAEIYAGGPPPATGTAPDGTYCPDPGMGPPPEDPDDCNGMCCGSCTIM